MTQQEGQKKGPGPTEFDSRVNHLWTTTEGFDRDYTLHVQAPRFGYDPDYNAMLKSYGKEPQIMAILEGVNEDTGEVRPEKYSCGPGWKSEDGGRTVTHSKREQFSNQSTYGIFIDQCYKAGIIHVMVDRWGIPDPRNADRAESAQ